MRTASALALALSLIACGDPASPADGELHSGIIAGRVQTVKAGATQLTEPVVNQVVRVKSGALLLRASTAGTVVNGSPVPGAVVCVYEQDHDLVPFARCTNTDADGKATFFFTPPTKAGEYIARINGSVTTNGVVEATTFDTAKATVEPGPVVTPAAAIGTDRVMFVGAKAKVSAILSASAAIDGYGNAYPAPVPTYEFSGGLTAVADSVQVDSVGASTIRMVATGIDASRTIRGYDDFRKGVTLSYVCIQMGSGIDSVKYVLEAVPPTTTVGTTTVTANLAFSGRRTDWVRQPDGSNIGANKDTAFAAFTSTQSSDSVLATIAGNGFQWKRSGARRYSSSLSLCSAGFTSRGSVALTVKP